ncbi:DUF2336 domain-containing protein [Rhizobium sp. SG_E_25_P2]|uniref:DUF2336 domain-containing protein n=1 Tax=Rhizobium sp. SG_E_25_P2 TaxID=2879942 RepID=UPI0024768254|nr:DUF2336 domain-containing protein [Rhizobium sp. SG_E_25_P2]
MSDGFRDLEGPPLTRTKDVVLMATVSSFEAMTHPGRNDVRQFSELFEPVFRASSHEAQRNAAAALARSPHVPRSVAWFLATQPIGVAALFLAASPTLDDELLIAAARLKGRDHAKAIAARPNLSVKVVDALVALHQGLPDRSAKPRADAAPQPAELVTTEPGQSRGVREEDLRRTLKSLVARDALTRNEESDDAAAEREEALLMRFARLREAKAFSRMLAHCLGSSVWLTNRIMLDLSGLQLATALMALGLHDGETRFALTQFYPHLSENAGAGTRAESVVAGLDADECADRVGVWIRADAYTDGQAEESAANGNGAAPQRFNAAQKRAAG